MNHLGPEPAEEMADAIFLQLSDASVFQPGLRFRADPQLMHHDMHPASSHQRPEPLAEAEREAFRMKSVAHKLHADPIGIAFRKELARSGESFRPAECGPQPQRGRS